MSDLLGRRTGRLELHPDARTRWLALTPGAIVFARRASSRPALSGAALVLAEPMPGGRRLHRYTYAQYVALEGASPTKHEFFDGEIYAMAGGSEEHSALAAEVLRIPGKRDRGPAVPRAHV